MNPVLRNILAVIGGIVLGSILNMTIVMTLGSVPEGVDPSDVESIKANIDRYEWFHFIVPFIAHALGTLLGAFIASKFGSTNKKVLALVVGAFFMIGGLAAVFMIPGPIWFAILDIAVAYIPMAILGHKLAGGDS